MELDMKAIGYIRVSTEKQVSDGVSLDNQQSRIESYCKYKELDLVEIVEDAGISGSKNKTRVGFNDLIAKLEQENISVLVLYSLERLSRDMLTLLSLERLLNEYNVELHTIEGQIDTSTPEGFMNFAMKSFLGEMERRSIKYRTHKAMQYKKGKNEVVGSIPYGYVRNGNGLVEAAAEQDIIKVANRMYKSGKRLVTICRSLQAKGHKTRNGKVFSPIQVRRMIQDYQATYSKNKVGSSNIIKEFVTAIA